MAQSARCMLCKQTILIPEGTTVDAAVMKHYWEQHPDEFKTIVNRHREVDVPQPA